MNRFDRLSSRVVLLPANDIDTDQIIPARFLKGTGKRGLGEHLFAEWRTAPDFPLLAPSAKGAAILFAGANFGCGSSREHAPWALVDWGFRAIVAQSFADIFRQNATKNGLLPVALGEGACRHIEAAVRAAPETTLTVDLATESVALPDGTTFTFPVDPFAKHCLLTGLDELGYILSFEERIAAHEKRSST